MGWFARKDGLRRRMEEVEAERKAAEANMTAIRTWLGNAREGRVEVAEPEPEEMPVLGVERRRARVRFFLWLGIFAAVVALAWWRSRH